MHLSYSPFQKNGTWGPVTATLDWCEANYQFSPYIAEMANSFSNIVTVGFAAYGLYHVWKESLPWRYLFGYAGVALVGLGSFAFHATLLFGPQLADELPMIYVVSFCLFLLFDLERGFSFSSGSFGRSLVTASLLFDVLFSWSYMIYRNPVYHQVVFATLLTVTCLRSIYLLRQPIPNVSAQTKTEVALLFTSGLALFLLGFLIWNLDNIFCDTITKWKVELGWPAAFILEGHAWWHVFTGWGTYLMVCGMTYLTLHLKDERNHYQVLHVFGLPRISRKAVETKSE